MKKRIIVRLMSDLREVFMRKFVRPINRFKVAMNEEMIKEKLREQFMRIFVKKVRVNKEIILARLHIVFRRMFVKTRKPSE